MLNKNKLFTLKFFKKLKKSLKIKKKQHLPYFTRR